MLNAGDIYLYFIRDDIEAVLRNTEFVFSDYENRSNSTSSPGLTRQREISEEKESGGLKNFNAPFETVITMKNQHLMLPLNYTFGKLKLGSSLPYYLSREIYYEEGVKSVSGLVDISISASFATGDVSGPYRIGGLVGINRNGKITNCFASWIITQSDHDVWQKGCFGGLVGVNSESTISNSYAGGNSVGTKDSIGGLVGYHQISATYSQRTVYNCYSLRTATGTDNIGGLVGWNNDPNVRNSYWNTQTSNHICSPAGEGRTTAEMTYPYAPDTYSGWDFTSIWSEDTANVNGGYPYLRDMF